MTLNFFACRRGSILAALVLSTGVARAENDNRPALIQQMMENCYTNHANDDPATKAKCECFARAFVNSLTPAEIAVPRKSAAINAKVADARRMCRLGDF